MKTNSRITSLEMRIDHKTIYNAEPRTRQNSVCRSHSKRVEQNNKLKNERIFSVIQHREYSMFTKL